MRGLGEAGVWLCLYVCDYLAMGLSGDCRDGVGWWAW